ncbi:HTH-type transcriptional regulator KdgR [compost metagenome]
MNTLGHHPGELLSLHRDIPMVLVDRQLAELNVDLVGLDNADAVEQALDHLQARGYRDVLAISEALDGTSSRLERVQAFGASIERRRGMRGQVLEIAGDLETRLAAFLESSGHGPQALFTCNGVATLAATRALRQLGCRLFEDVGLLALDELDWYPLVGSGITALAQPTERIGVAAFECLLGRLRGDEAATRRIDFKAELIIRGSTHPRG